MAKGRSPGKNRVIKGETSLEISYADENEAAHKNVAQAGRKTIGKSKLNTDAAIGEIIKRQSIISPA